MCDSDHEPATDMNDASPEYSETDLSNPQTYHDWAGSHYPLERGEAVYDIRELVTATDPDGEPGVAIVVDTHPPDETDVHTESFERNGSECTLAGYHLNRLYADFDLSTRVVTIAWDSLLDQRAPQWRKRRGDPDAMLSYIDELERDWDIPLRAHDRTYSYPESRLAPQAALPDGVVDDA